MRRIAALIRSAQGAPLAEAVRHIAPAVRALERHELWHTFLAPVRGELVAARQYSVTLVQLNQAQVPDELTRWLLANALERAAGLCEIYQSRR